MKVSGQCVGLLVVAACHVGCSPGKLEQVENKLKACNDRNVQLSSTARDLEVCRQEYSQFKQWKDQVELDLIKTAPPGLKRERALQVEEIHTLPQEIRVEVEKRVDRFFLVVMKEFNEEKRRHAELLNALSRTHKQTEQTQETVEKVVVGTSEIQANLATLQHHQEEEHAQVERQHHLTEEAHRIVEEIARFDGRIDCKSCPDKVGMFSAKKEILKFHSDLLKDLSALQKSIESQ